jgi:hypothetical protein
VSLRNFSFLSRGKESRRRKENFNEENRQKKDINAARSQCVWRSERDQLARRASEKRKYNKIIVSIKIIKYKK